MKSVGNLQKKKLQELRQELRSLGLPTTGNKPDLVKRLLGIPSLTYSPLESTETEAVQSTPKKQKKAVPKSGSKSERIEQPEDEDILQYLHDEGWKTHLMPEFNKPYFQEIVQFLKKETSEGKTILPPKHEIFNAFNSTPFESVKVVIIGQDPYINEDQAHGLCFSVRKGVKIPPSLNTMYKELERCIPDFKIPKHGCLEDWAKRGVLLLNATLTVEKGKSNSHAKCGWQTFTDAVIDLLNQKKDGLVFLLWGGFAQKKGKKIDGEKHRILESAHPSPMAAGAFNGSKCFKITNDVLQELGKEPIDWTLS